ncbi:MAG: metal-dependent hydrolase [Steroidobacteraceae bacterium]
MDNLTHTLIGVAIGEAVSRCLTANSGGTPQVSRRNLLVTLGAAGSNLPDVDLLWSYGFGRSPLHYLLEHRGYTHTIVGCIGLALLLYLAAMWWAQRQRLPASRYDRLTFAATALFAVCLHLGMDALNSYGVHPFWPFDNRWYYGDSLFIVEPLYWVAAAPLLFLMRTWFARGALLLALLAAVVIGFFMYATQTGWSIAIALITIGLVFAGRAVTPRAATLMSTSSMAGVTMMFVFAGVLASNRASGLAAAQFAGARTLDTVLSPTPMNPLCWDVLFAQLDGFEYRARRAMLAIAPGVLQAEHCPRLTIATHTTAPLHEVAATDTPAVAWLGEFHAPLSVLQEVALRSCEMRELLQFARVPFATRTGTDWIVGDLRYDRETELGLSELRLGVTPAPCRHSAPWRGPRESLLESP